jgi:hypothetical protein
MVASNEGYRLRREKSDQGILAPVQDASVRVRADTDIFEEALERLGPCDPLTLAQADRLLESIRAAVDAAAASVEVLLEERRRARAKRAKSPLR